MDYSFNNVKSNLYWELIALNYTDIDSKIIDKYFFTEQNLNVKLKQFNEANKIINDKIFNPDILFKCYIESIKDENIVLLYEIFNQLLKMSNQQDYATINDFLKLLSDQENENFYKIHEIYFNGYIIKNFLIILSELIKNNKKCKALNTSINNTIINRFPKDDLLIETVFNIIKRVNDIIKKHNPIYDYSVELRDVLIWCLNVLNELLTMSESKQDDTRKLEYTGIYNNSITIMSQRIHLLRIIESFINDTPLMSSLCRLMRKATQNITYDSSSLLDRSQIPGRPKDISKQFKILMIEKYNGLFLHSLNVLLHKYQHYSELHYNILIIIYQVINSLESKHLIDAGNKLGLSDFKENFSIYRGKIKTFSKMLNNLHLNILYVFSEINKTNFNEIDSNMKTNAIEIVKNIIQDLKSFYRETKANKKRIEDFKINKFNEIDIHEIISRIFCNLTKSSESLNMIGCEESILEDVFEFLIRISNVKKESNLIKTHLESDKKRRRNIDELRKLFLSIIDNTLIGMKNLVEGESLDYYNKFLVIVEKKFAKLDYLNEVFSSMENVMNENNINSNKFSNCVKFISDSLGKFWNNEALK